MLNATIHFKGGNSIEIKNLTAIDVHNSRGYNTLTAEFMETVNLNPKHDYVFIAEKETISITGADVLFVHFCKS